MYNQLPMNYPQQSSDPSVIQQGEHQKDVSNKLFQNYKQIKHSIRRQQLEKESSKKSTGSVQRAIQIEQLKNLETRIALTEKQYTKARQNNILLLKKLGQAQENGEFLKFEIEKIKRQKQQQVFAYATLIDKFKNEIAILRDSREKHARSAEDEQSSPLRDSLQISQKQINRLNLKAKSLEMSLFQKQAALKKSFIQIQELQCKIKNLQVIPHQIILDQNSEGSQILQLQQYRLAIQRLLYLLRGTEQYRNFFTYSQNSQQIYFLHQISKSLKNGSLNIEPERRTTYQRLLWSPANCYKALLQIKLKHHSLNEACIEQILFQLNRLWLSRQQNHVTKIKEHFQSELAKLKRKHAEKYDQLVARKQIQRLKKQLQENRFSKRNQSEQFHLLKNLGQYEDQIRLKDKEVKLLNDRIRILESQNVNYDKILYLEGALWVIEKFLDELQSHQQQLKRNQLRLQNKFEQMNSAVPFSVLLKDCFESFGELTSSLYQKLLQMKEATSKRMGFQKQQSSVNGLQSSPFA